MKLIPLSQTDKHAGKDFIQVDDEDYEKLSKYKWNGYGAGNLIYAIAWVEKKHVRMHRYILGINDPMILIDHIDRNTLNNQKSNLRIATPSENQKNKKPSGESQYLGVSLHFQTKAYVSKKTGIEKLFRYSKWRSQINNNGKVKHLGMFLTEYEAAKAYDEAAKKYHGEFANLNFKNKVW